MAYLRASLCTNQDKCVITRFIPLPK